ncbi:MAG: LmbE family protein, partial [Sphingobacteriaceae bacterium]
SNQNDIVLEPNKFNTVNAKVQFADQKASHPYWLDTDHTIGTYTIQNQENVGLPENKLPFSGRFSIKIGNQTINTSQPIVYKFTDPVRGEVVQPIVIAPPVTATLSEKGYIFTSNEPKKMVVQLQSFRDNSSGTLQAQVPAGWKVSPESISFNLSKKGNIQTKEFIITPNGGVPSGELSIKVTIGNTTYNQGIKEIKYDHIPAQTLFPTAEARLEKLDLKTTGKTIVYITGAGDLVAESLKQIGYKVSILTTEQALNTSLSGFDAVITGVRLYNIDPQVKLLQPKLLQYVSNGGVLLVQYNVSNPLQLENMGPYPFKLSRNRVTEEDADVRFVAPNHQVLNYPNKITQKDFEGWVQERGLYFTTDADKAYTPILSMNDTNESPKDGSLLVADYGKGRFVYTSLSFFRQLPAGIPGAYRLFVNLISK